MSDDTTDTPDTPDTTDAAAVSMTKPTGSSSRRSGADTENRAPRRSPLLPIVLLVLAVALAITGTVLLVRAHSLDNERATSNHALTDAGTTSEVIGQVSTALNQVLSYDYRKPDVARAAAKRWLTGDAPAQYTVLFKQLQQLAPGQKLTLVAKVSTAGVTSLKGDTAQLLVFLDQQSTRASDGQRSVSAAQVQITAVHVGDGWKISELKPI